jgi:hypothetical protein
MAFVWRGMSRQHTFPLPVSTFGPVGAGMLVAAFGTYTVPLPDSGVYNFPGSIAFWALGAIPVAAGLWLLGSWLERRNDDTMDELVLDWRWVYGAGIALTALVTSAMMRAHNGGYLNVQIPALWVICVGFGLVVERAMAEIPTRPIRLAAAAVLSGQCLWSLALLDPSRLIPTEADLALGERFVDEIASVNGPVLSPFAAWLPVYAGRPPSLHYMGVWDLDYKGGPYRAQVQVVRDAMREQRWSLVVAGSQKFPYGTADAYDTRETLVDEKDPAMMPKMGWPARPNRLLFPSPPEEAPPEEVGAVTP